MTFNRNLLIGFGLSLLLLIISSVASLVSINGYKRSSNMVAHTEEVMRNLESAISALKDAETGQRGYLLTGEESFLEPYKTAMAIAPAYGRKIKELTADNHEQQVSADQFLRAIQNRLNRLGLPVEHKKQGINPGITDLQIGKQQMDEVRALVQQMKSREEILLVQRNSKMISYGRITPFIIILAAIISLGIATIFYRKMRRDYEARYALQTALEAKDVDLTRRIAIIQEVAEKISDGQYDTRTRDDGEHGIGTLSASLNKMAAGLQKSFMYLADEEWLQKGIRGLAESLLGVQKMDSLTSNALYVTATYTGSQVGALYLYSEQNSNLHLAAGFALSPGKALQTIAAGEGLTGRCFAEQKLLMVNNIEDDNWGLATVAGDVHPRSVIAIPMKHDGEVKGVIELASLNNYTDRELRFFEAVSGQTGILINALQSNLRVRGLLQETQTQTEELQAQHSELENINAELEAQSQKLQASEEELRVQQEELMQANSELEERAHLLEKRNEEIAARTRELSEKAKALELSTKYKSEFLANMSHELRTPLNSILLLSRLMADNTSGNLSSEQVEFATVIQSAGKGLLSLIDEILDLSKIEAGKMELEWDEVPLAEIAGNMQDLFLQVARQKGLDLHITLANDLPDTVETDEQRLEQILKNLLSNALKFTSKGTVALHIQKAENGAISFRVEDTGIGIAAGKQEAIFEAFEQEDGSTQRKYGGTGLGLAISRELSRLLGGKISLNSEEGRGSVFTLIIPAVRVSAVAETDSALPANSIADKAESALPLQNFDNTKIPAAIPDDRDKAADSTTRKLLIIEDDIGFAKTLLGLTRKRGYDGIVAVRGDEGVALARRHQPSAILLDIQLPVMDGWQVMHELKTDTATRHIPVHIISSQTESRKQSLREGAIDFIAKPVAPEDMTAIFQKIESVLSRESKKVLILEENSKHATALAGYLENFSITPEVAHTLEQSVDLLQQKEIDCVILDMEIPDKQAYEVLETIKKTPGLEQLPVIIYTGKSLSKTEEERIRKYADSIVVKTAHSYQRMLDEVSLFLHLVEQTDKPKTQRPRRMQGLTDILKDKTILVVDDDVRNIFSLSKALEQHGVKVVAATDGKDALEQLSAHAETDLVLMDMMMPEMDGYEATKAIRKNPDTRHMPVIAITAKAMSGDRERCINAGASDYITKPVDMDQLLSLLRVWLYER